MSKLKEINRYLIDTNLPNWFEYIMVFVILVNSVLIGVETYFFSSTVLYIQNICLWIFTCEIFLRFIFRDRGRSFFQSGWNVFDLILVIINHIPLEILENSNYLFGLRVLRALRVLRLLRTTEEIELIITAFSKSLKLLGYNALFFAISLYLFAIVGVTIFKLPSETKDPLMKEKLSLYYEIAPNAPACSPDPYGSLGETTFTLFRILTGEDWTDIRYNLIKANEIGIIKIPQFAITAYHVLWFVVAVYLFTNLLIGAIVTNYQEVVNERRKNKS